MPAGGSRNNAGRKSTAEKQAKLPGQQTIFGASRPTKKKAAAVTVEESRRRQQEEEEEARRLEESRQRQEERSRLLEEERRKKREQDEKDRLKALRLLAESAEAYSREYGTDDDLEDFSDDEDDEEYEDSEEENDDDDEADDFDSRMFTPGRKRQKTKLQMIPPLTSIF